jgi:hypothetical protein
MERETCCRVESFYEHREDFSLFSNLLLRAKNVQLLKDCCRHFAVERVAGGFRGEITINAGEKLRGIEGKIAFRHFLTVFRNDSRIRAIEKWVKQLIKGGKMLKKHETTKNVWGFKGAKLKGKFEIRRLERQK